MCFNDFKVTNTYILLNVHPDPVANYIRHFDFFGSIYVKVLIKLRYCWQRVPVSIHPPLITYAYSVIGTKIIVLVAHMIYFILNLIFNVFVFN